MENHYSNTLWDRKYTNTVIGFTVLLLGVLVVFLYERMVNPVWFPITLFIVVWYFTTLTKYSAWWSRFPDGKFEKKLFWHSLGYRVLFGLIIIIISELTWQQPYYVGAVDAIGYHTSAVRASEQFGALNFAAGFRHADVTGKIDDIGPALYLGILYIFTGGFYLFGVLFLALLGAISVVFLYKTARIIFGEYIARTSGLMYMHFPLALFYNSVTQKEGFVIFFLIMVVYIMTRTINGYSVSFKQLLLLVFCLVSLFFFRTAVGLGAVVLVASAFAINKYKGSYVKSIAIGVASLGVFFIIMYQLGEIQYFLDRASSAGNVATQRTSQLISNENIEIVGISIFDLIASPVYLIVAVLAPFPAMVEVGTAWGTPFDQNYYNSPGRIIWNVLAFFSFIGLWHTLKDRLFSGLMVWGFSIGYLYILIATVTFTRERFAFLGMPFLLILAAVGIYKTKNRLLWYGYLVFLIGIILIWNTLRLGARGLA
jgi:hypothetical protein